MSSTSHRLEHVVEETIESLDASLAAARRRIARRFGIGVLRALVLGVKVALWALLIAYFAFGLVLLGTRYWVLPRLDTWRGQIEALASDALRAPVSIGQLSGGWRGFNPHLALADVRISGPDGAETVALPRVEATVSWASLLTMEPRFRSLTILAPELEVTRLPGDRFSVAGFVMQAAPGAGDSKAADWLLAQDRIVIRDARVHYRDDRQGSQQLDLTDVNLLIEQRLGAHRFALQATPTAALAAPIDLRGQFRRPRLGNASDVTKWRGEVFVRLEYADLAAASKLINLPVAIAHAHGALRGWLAFDSARVTRMTADLALQDVDVKLADDLEPLRLSSLQGRISQRIYSEDWRAVRVGDEFSVKGLTFSTASSRFAPLDMTVRHTRASADARERTLVDADRIDLTTLAALAPHLPLARDLRETLARHAIRGTLTDLSAHWDGDIPAVNQLTLKTRFAGLASAAQPATVVGGDGRHRIGLPGFENLSGTIDVARGTGTLHIASKNAALIFPGVFAEPRLAFDALATTLRWRTDAQVEVRVESLHASNAAADISGSGWYRTTATGPGWIDLNGRITRGVVTEAYRYLPLEVGPKTLDWVQHALVAGRLSDASFRLKGDLSRFPFRKGDGEFRAVGRVTGGVLDVDPVIATDGTRAPPGAVWPLLSGIDAELVFDRASMTITAQNAEAMGARIGTTVAHVADLDDALLDVRGQARGALPELLRYANQSPVVRWTAGITRVDAATGPARLDLRLQIPLAHADDSKVAGTLHFQGNDVALKGFAPFTGTNGALQFTERGIRINGLTAGFLGGTTRIEADTRADGAHVFAATGTATPAGLQRALSIAPLTRLLDRSQGSARYQASLIVKDGTALHVESDLAGLAIDGVAPLAKTAAETLPLRIDLKPTGADGDEIQINVGTSVAVRVQRRHGQRDSQIVRGVVAINETPNLPDRGILLLASAPRIDLEAWSVFLGAEGAGRTAVARDAADPQIDVVALRTPELVLSGRVFRNVTLGATRLADGGYEANVASDHAVGYVAWRPGAAGSRTLGHVNARLARLALPSHRKDEVVEALRAPAQQIPSLEISVEQFELGDMQLGRLELAASNTGTGAASTWRVHRLEVSNPDLRLEASGVWAPADAAATGRRMKMHFALDINDAGAAVTRFGYPATMSRGRGRMEGDLDWMGSPLELDLPTLSGTLNLALDNGRFLKADAGNAARLLSLLSLQSLSRALVVDGGKQFAEGFAYTTMRADAKIDRGTLATDNFRMNAANAVVLMSGSVDLKKETQQLQVVVLPEIDASTAALALGVANPILGLGTYLAQLVLRDPLSKAFALQYDVSGTWGDPIVARRPRLTASAAESSK